MSETSMKINHLPSLTWHRLGVNCASVSLPEHFAGGVTIANRGGDGIVRTVVPAKEAFSRVRELGEGDKRETYIAGKSAIYRAQAFATGLGGAFTDYAKAHAEEVCCLQIPADAAIETPYVIERTYGADAAGLSVLFIHAERGAKAQVIVTEASEAEAAGLAASLIYVYLEEDASVQLSRVNLLGSGYTQLDDLGAILKGRASFTLTDMKLGGAKVYGGAYAEQQGAHSAFHVNTGYMAGEDHLLDINYVTAQFGRRSESEILVKGVLSGQARKVFRGTIDFRRGSVGAVGNEQEDVLLLSDDVVNQTIPVILCEEEDVDGRHGATIGKLSDDILFYMGSRGIDREEAERIMIEGRLRGVSREIPDEDIRSRIDQQIGEVCGRL